MYAIEVISLSLCLDVVLLLNAVEAVGSYLSRLDGTKQSFASLLVTFYKDVVLRRMQKLLVDLVCLHSFLYSGIKWISS